MAYNMIAENDRIPTTCLLNGDVVKASEALDFPTTGIFAWRLWNSLSSYNSPLTCKAATKLYRNCGYIPFSGYPLARSGKIPNMTRDEAERELENNPLCVCED